MIHCQCPGDVYAEMDLERIKQVMVNLVENAIKFSEPFLLPEARRNGKEPVLVWPSAKGLLRLMAAGFGQKAKKGRGVSFSSVFPKSVEKQ